MDQEIIFRILFILSGVTMFAIRIYYQSKVKGDLRRSEMRDSGPVGVFNTISDLAEVFWGGSANCGHFAALARTSSPGKELSFFRCPKRGSRARGDWPLSLYPPPDLLGLLDELRWWGLARFKLGVDLRSGGIFRAVYRLENRWGGKGHG